MKNVQIELRSQEPLNIGLLMDEQYGIIFFLNDRQLTEVQTGNAGYAKAAKNDLNRLIKNYLETFKWENEYLYISLSFPKGKAFKPEYTLTCLNNIDCLPFTQALKDFVYKYDGSSKQAYKLTYDFQMFARQLQGIK